MGEKGGGNAKSREPRIKMRHWASLDRRAVLPLKPDRLADAERIVSPNRLSLTGFDTDLITFRRVSKSNRWPDLRYGASVIGGADKPSCGAIARRQSGFNPRSGGPKIGFHV